MRYLAISLVLWLSGCAAVPVAASFPEAPAMLMERCADLKLIAGEKISIVDFVKIITENYTTYHECSAQNQAWQEWYTTQKKIWDEVQ